MALGTASLFVVNAATGKTLSITLRKVDTDGTLGDWWDQNGTSAWIDEGASEPTYANKKILLTEGTAEDLGEYTVGSLAAFGTYTGRVLYKVHDEGASNKTIASDYLDLVSGTPQAEFADILGSGWNSSTDTLQAIKDTQETAEDIADAVWDELQSEHQGSTTFGYVATEIGEILVDTGTTLDDKLDDIQGATFSTMTDSLEAIRDQGDAAWVTGAGGSDRLLMVDTTIATLASQTEFTLTAGSPDNDAYNNCTIIIRDASDSTQKAVGIVSDYVGSTSKTVTLKNDPGIFTMAATDKVYILAENSLKTSERDRYLAVTATGAAGIDWGNIENPTTTVDLSGTDIQLCDTITTYTGNTVQTGDTYALANGASGFVATKADTADILIDTADMQPKLGTITDLGAGTTVGDNLSDIAGATFATATDSLEAIRDRGDASWTGSGSASDRFLLQETTIATLASQTSFTLTAGSTDDDAYNNCTIVIEDADTAAQKAVGVISDYTGSTKTVTLAADPGVFTMIATDNVYILAQNIDAIADAVWDEAIGDHTTADTTGDKLGEAATAAPTPISPVIVHPSRTFCMHDTGDGTESPNLIEIPDGAATTVAFDFSRVLNPGTGVSTGSIAASTGLAFASTAKDQSGKQVHTTITPSTTGERTLTVTATSTDSQPLTGKATLNVE